MVDEVIRVIIDPRQAEVGSARVQRSLNQIDNSVGGTVRQIGTLRNSLFGLAGALGIREVLRYADAWTRTNNLLTLATDSSAELAQVQRDLFQVSQDTRSSFEAQGQLYNRLSLAAGELGASNEQLINFTRGVGQALAISGTNANQARGALIQLSQAVGAGTVRAEEFNSILEGAPRIAQAVANGLDEAGGSVARLRQILLAGNLTSREFFDAFNERLPQLQREFTQTTPTIAQSLTVLENSFIRLVGRFDETTNTSRGISSAFIGIASSLDNLSNNMEETIRQLTILTATFIAFRNAGNISAFVSLIRAQVELRLAVASGNATLIEGVQAERAKAAAALDSARAAEASARQAVASAAAERNLTATQLDNVRAVQAALIAERELEVVRLQAQISDIGRAQSLSRLAEIRRSELALTAQLTAAENALAASNARLTATQNSLTTAQAATTASTTTLTSATAAATVGARIYTAATVGLTRAVAFLGGPLGIAIIAAGAIAFFATRQDEAAEASQRATDVINDQVDALTNLSDIEARSAFGAAQTSLINNLEVRDRLTRELIAAQEELNRVSENVDFDSLIPVSPEQVQAIGTARDRVQELQSQYDNTNETVNQLQQTIDRLYSQIVQPIDFGSGGTDFTTQQANAFRRLQDELDPIGALQRELVENQNLVNAAQAAGEIGTGRQVELLNQLAVAYGRNVEAITATIDPFSNLDNLIQRQAETIGLTTRELRVESELRDILTQQQAQGVILTDSETNTLRNKLTTLAALNDRQQAYNSLLSEIRGPVQEVNTSLTALNDLLAQGAITTNEFRLQFLDLQSQVEELEFADAFELQLLRMQEDAGETFQIIGTQVAQVFGPGGTLESGIADATGRAVAFGDSFTNIVRNLGRTILSQLVSALVTAAIRQTGLNTLQATGSTAAVAGLQAVNASMLTTAATGTAAIAATTAAASSAGATVAAAWAAAAALVSLGSFGANSVAAAAGISAVTALTAGIAAAANVARFADGGFVSGAGGPRDDAIPAMLSNGEFVVNADATRRHRGLLEAMNSNRRPVQRQNGGAVGTTNASLLGTTDTFDRLLQAIEDLAQTRGNTIIFNEPVNDFETLRETLQAALADDINNGDFVLIQADSRQAREINNG